MLVFTPPQSMCYQTVEPKTATALIKSGNASINWNGFITCGAGYITCELPKLNKMELEAADMLRRMKEVCTREEAQRHQDSFTSGFSEEFYSEQFQRARYRYEGAVSLIEDMYRDSPLKIAAMRQIHRPR